MPVLRKALNVSGNTMKRFILIFILSCAFKTADCQCKVIDSLIQLLDNRQIRGECHYGWEIHMRSDAGRKLISMGKEVYPYLIPYLEDSCKGIVVHFIMQAIFSKANLGMGNSSFDKVNATSATDLNGLNICTDTQHPYYFVKREDLVENKRRWLDRIKMYCR